MRHADVITEFTTMHDVQHLMRLSPFTTPLVLLAALGFAYLVWLIFDQCRAEWLLRRRPRVRTHPDVVARIQANAVRDAHARALWELRERTVFSAMRRARTVDLRSSMGGR